MAGAKIPTQSASEWCASLDVLLKDETLTPHERAEIKGVKKAMERRGFKNQEPKVKEASNGA